MRNTFKAVLISPDGKDHVTDCRGCKFIQEVWDQVDNMGSRWFFYPLPFVVNERTNKIRGCSQLFDDVMNCDIETAKKCISNSPDRVDFILEV